MAHFPIFSVFLLFLATFVVADKNWKQFKLDHGKDYSHPQVDTLRRELFMKQDAVIKLHNSQPHTWKMAHSFISDLTQEERQKYLGLKEPSEGDLEKIDNSTSTLAEFPKLDRASLPDSVDYRNDVCMPPVKNQGRCGSCWAFAALNPLEFASCKKNNNKLQVLSEQQLVDCVYPKDGCGPGWSTTAMRYLMGGSALNSAIPYIAKYTGKCNFVSSMKVAAVNKLVQPFNWKYDETVLAMQTALVQNNTINVGIHVANDWMSYGSGVYSPTVNCNKNVNHGVVIVGYGTQDGIKYWIVRNSWGPGWGAKGYILMKRGVNQCFIERFPAYVIPL